MIGILNKTSNINSLSMILKMLLCTLTVLSSTFVFSARDKRAVQKETTHAVYLKYHFDIEKRNPTLFLVPSLYTIAKGNRHYFGELYGTIRNDTLGKTHLNELLRLSTIGSSSRTMPVMLDYINPKLYAKTIFGDNILSPFHRSNRKLYKFRHGMTRNRVYTLHIRPRTNNPQLVWGSAVISEDNGRIVSCTLHGEYDMLKYEVKCEMNVETNTPEHCYAKSRFAFLGNKISTRFEAHYDMDVKELPGQLTKAGKMAIVRPDTLTAEERNMYAASNISTDTSTVNPASDSLAITKKNNRMLKNVWRFLDNYVMGSLKSHGENGEIKMSPLIDPTRLSYSNSKGLSYKIKLSARYNFSENHALSLTPRFGYNFKLKRLFIQAPMTWEIHRRHNQWVRMAYESGNRITHSSIIDALNEEHGDKIDFTKMDLQYFYDHKATLEANTNIGKCLSLNVGLQYHRRTATNKAVMEALGKETEYKSCAPSVTLTVDPMRNGPVLTINYERSIKGWLGSNTEYERWEGDISYNKTLNAGRQYNLRIGGGFYTNRSTDYFVDYGHFRDNYLNDSWSDDWTGRFQLLSSQWYNASEYYLKANVAYESPLMLATWVPWVGRYIETERLYFSTLRIQHTRLYSELGYGFTTRFVTIGLFASFLNTDMQEFGAKFSVELFRKW